MKKSPLPWIAAGLALAWLASSFAPARGKAGAAAEFGRLPVLLNGRVQPLDSVARNALLQFRTKQTVHVPSDPQSGGKARTLPAIEWLQEMLFQPEVADTRPSFRIDHPEVISLLKLGREDKHFSFAEIRPGAEALEREARRIHEEGLKPEQQTPYQKAVSTLFSRLVLYQNIKNSLKPERVTDLAARIDRFEKSIGPGRAAAEAEREGKPHDKAAFDAFIAELTDFDFVSRSAYPLMIPGPEPGHQRDDWRNAGAAMMDAARTGAIPEPMRFYATLHDAFRAGDASRFNQGVADYRAWLEKHGYQQELAKGRSEHLYNQLQLFYRAMALYVAAFLCAAVSWFNRGQSLRLAGAALTWIALVAHTAGVIYRMVLEGRPPVTNLYSSAVFIGWGTALFGLALEKFQRDGIGIVVGGLTGFTTLVIAHNLSMSGDTMEMLRAVLDTNFWLATHVVVITLGYSATFVAGFLAVLYVVRGFFTSSLAHDTASALARMVYGVTCFATLFSFTGTVLGGIWADQSWGRFWGWDPKENGALLIVIWNAFYLHARWGRLLNDRQLMAVAIAGNIITAFSWFGVNMLGIGLHAYGFMDAAFKWLVLFDVTQLALIGLALAPLRFWRSFRDAAKGIPSPRQPRLVPRAKTA